MAVTFGLKSYMAILPYNKGLGHRFILPTEWCVLLIPLLTGPGLFSRWSLALDNTSRGAALTFHGPCCTIVTETLLRLFTALNGCYTNICSNRHSSNMLIFNAKATT